jgi:hypothetical protein
MLAHPETSGIPNFHPAGTGFYQMQIISKTYNKSATHKRGNGHDIV